jgi:RecA/RadA recombinase
MAKKKEEGGVEVEANDSGSRISRVLASETLAKIKKKWGSNIVQLASDEGVREKHVISSGILMLDWALGGGWPAGRINTIYGLTSSGKTTCMLHAIAQAQLVCASCFTARGEDEKCKCGTFREHVCAYINVEGTWDDVWAKRAGVNTANLMYSRPEYAEQSLDILESLIRGGDVDLIVLDSLAFLTPIAEIENSVDKETMGVQPRLLGKGVRKCVSALTNAKQETGRFPTIFFTNQIRMKIGVMFGCFHSDTPVMFADGRQIPIGQVVRGEMEGPVLSWNGSSIVERKITAWHENGLLDSEERWLTFRVEGSGGRRGSMGFTCTPNHVLVCSNGTEINAASVKVGDELLSWYEADLSEVEKALPLPSISKRRRVPIGVRVIGIKDSKKKHRSRVKYDLTVEGDSYYLVGGDSRGVIVHNSPETRPGGMAPQFASTTEVKTRSGDYKIDEEVGAPLHVTVHFKVEKNKVDRPKMEGDFKVMLSDTQTKHKGDIYEEDTMVDLAQKFGLLEGHGNSWTCLGEKYNGKSVVERKLLTDPAYKKMFHDSLMKVLLAL